MALFLPILRLFMLFLNVYDSYKTLKPPPPSSRNPARPSVRAMTQRKRDMKGCLAIWIVWVSLALYERVLESIVSLFIPFYDEFKSLVFVFLIITRAKGAEPIFLHLIRPLVKPYTTTLDAVLDLMLTITDFVMALFTHPIRLAVQWWKSESARIFGGSKSEDPSDESSLSDTSSSFSDQPPTRLPRGRGARPLQRSSNGTSNGNRHPYSSADTRHHREFFRDDPPPESVSSSIRSIGSRALPTPDSGNGEIEASTSYQFWQPPPVSYTVNSSNDGRNYRPMVSVDTREHISEQQTEWGQYPPFPAAYPPTPIVTKLRPVNDSLSLSPLIYPPIPEESNSQQDFRQVALSQPGL